MKSRKNHNNPNYRKSRRIKFRRRADSHKLFKLKSHRIKKSHYKTSISTIYTTWAKKKSQVYSKKIKKAIILVTKTTLSCKMEKERRVSVKI